MIPFKSRTYGADPPWHGFRNHPCRVPLELALPDEPDADVHRTVEALEAYLANHPLAGDSEQGIAQWWLRAWGVDMPMSTVRRALAAMLAHGRLQAHTLPDGQPIYRAAPAASLTTRKG